MTILAAIRREERKLEKQLGKLNHQLSTRVEERTLLCNQVRQRGWSLFRVHIRIPSATLWGSRGGPILPKLCSSAGEPPRQSIPRPMPQLKLLLDS
jgi:hypothetical protein